MAPPAKRASSAAGPAARKKARAAPAAEPAEQMRTDIAEALDAATELSDPTRAMLAAMVPGSVCIRKHQRHPHQQAVAEMIKGALLGVERRLEEQRSGLQAQLDRAAEEKQGLQAALGKVEASYAAKISEVQAAHGEQRERGAARAEAEAALAAARAAAAEAEGERQHVADQRARCLAVASESLTSVSQGQGAQEHVARLIKLGKDLSFDESLLNGLPAAALKDPASRGPFDNMLVNNFEEMLRKHLADLEVALASRGEATAQRAAEVPAAEAALEAARAGEKAAADKMAGLDAQANELQAQERSAKKAVRDYTLEHARTACAKAELELDQFRAATLKKIEAYEMPPEKASAERTVEEAPAAGGC